MGGLLTHVVCWLGIFGEKCWAHSLVGGVRHVGGLFGGCLRCHLGARSLTSAQRLTATRGRSCSAPLPIPYDRSCPWLEPLIGADRWRAVEDDSGVLEARGSPEDLQTWEDLPCQCGVRKVGPWQWPWLPVRPGMCFWRVCG